MEGTCILLKTILMANEEVIGDYLKIQIESIVRMFGYDYPHNICFSYEPIWQHNASLRKFYLCKGHGHIRQAEHALYKLLFGIVQI